VPSVESRYVSCSPKTCGTDLAIGRAVRTPMKAKRHLVIPATLCGVVFAVTIVSAENQAVRLCAQAGLVKLGHVALDGTKINANASKHKAMSYGRMKQAEPALAAEVAGWLERAAAADAAEDAALGADQRGDELPAWVHEKQQRLAKIRAAKAALEAEAAVACGDNQPPSDAPPPAPPDKAQRNFTDPDSAS